MPHSHSDINKPNVRLSPYRYTAQETYGLTSLSPTQMDQLVIRLATDDALFYEYMRWGDGGSDVTLVSLLLLCQRMDIETSLYSHVYPTSCMVCWICTMCVSSGTTRIIKLSLPWTVMWTAARKKCVALSPVTPPPTSHVAALRRSLMQRSPRETHNGTRRKRYSRGMKYLSRDFTRRFQPLCWHAEYIN